ncbi:MAG: hypothetical protein ABSC11_07060 [Smithella sp.]
MRKFVYSSIFIISFFVFIFVLVEKNYVQEIKSPPESFLVLLDSLKVKAVSYWGDRLCIAHRLEDTYELEIYRRNSSKKLIKIYATKIDGIYRLDGVTSEDLLIVYGSSTVATEINLLRWDKANQKVVSFDDNRFDGDSRLRPEILYSTKGFKILTFGNINDMGNELDKSKYYTNIYTFEKGSLVDVKKRVPFSKRYYE